MGIYSVNLLISNRALYPISIMIVPLETVCFESFFFFPLCALCCVLLCYIEIL